MMNTELIFTFRTIRVLQTEAGFVPFCHSGPVECKEVIVCEHFNAVVVPVNTPSNQSVTNDHQSDQLYLLYPFNRFVSFGALYLKEAHVVN